MNLSLDKLIHRIEKECSNEFHLLEEVGAAFFSTAQLIELRGVWKSQYQLFFRVQKKLLLLVILSPTWLVISGILFLMDLSFIGNATLMLFPFSFFVFIIANMILPYFLGSKGYLEGIGGIINSELRKRKRQFHL